MDFLKLISLKHFVYWLSSQPFKHVYCLLMILQFLSDCVGLLCMHTIPDDNGRVLIPHGNFHCCGCNEGEYVGFLCKGQHFENTTICTPCPFDATNPKNQTYMNHGPHLERQCKKPVESCSGDEVRITGNRCFPARCVESHDAPRYKVYGCRVASSSPEEEVMSVSDTAIPWKSVVIALSVALAISLGFNIYQWWKKRDLTTNDAQPGAKQKTLEKQGTPTKLPKRPLSDASLADSLKTLESKKDGVVVIQEEKHSKCIPSTPLLKSDLISTENDDNGKIQPTVFFTQREMKKAIVDKIKMDLSIKIDRGDALRFLRIFGVSTNDINNADRYNDDMPERFIRLFEICEKSSKGETITPENIAQYFRNNKLPDLEALVCRAIDAFGEEEHA